MRLIHDDEGAEEAAEVHEGVLNVAFALALGLNVEA